jgi:hypothetical protein
LIAKFLHIDLLAILQQHGGDIGLAPGAG